MPKLHQSLWIPLQLVGMRSSHRVQHLILSNDSTSELAWHRTLVSHRRARFNAFGPTHGSCRPIGRALDHITEGSPPDRVKTRGVGVVSAFGK